MRNGINYVTEATLMTCAHLRAVGSVAQCRVTEKGSNKQKW